jgi:hypothetical protein
MVENAIEETRIEKSHGGVKKPVDPNYLEHAILEEEQV